MGKMWGTEEGKESKIPKTSFQDRITGKNGSAIYTSGEVRRRSKFKEEKFTLRNTEFEMTGASSVL